MSKFKKIIVSLFIISLFSNIKSVSNASNLPPVTSSKHIIVIDRKTQAILYEKDGFSKTPMASTTKIMTCILVIENCSMTEIVTVSKKATLVSGSTIGLSPNSKVSIKDLLYGLMLRSGNDCAIALAEHVSGSVESFSFLMNEKAKELNLKNTNFVTPHGLDNENHYTTAYDLALLTDYALKNEIFKEIVSTKTYTININENCLPISNTNELLGNVDGVYGVKTGFTFEAGRCLVSACKRNDLDIIAVVLGADSKSIRTKDSCNIINYIFQNYTYVDLFPIISEAFSNFVFYFNKNFILEKTNDKPILILEQSINYYFPLTLEDISKLSTKVYCIEKFSPNLKENSKIGTIYLYKNNDLIYSSNILLENHLEKTHSADYFKYILKNIINLYK